MKRVAIIGSGGAGKSTMARKLGHALNREVAHLDALFWKPNWVGVPRQEQTIVQKELVEQEELEELGERPGMKKIFIVGIVASGKTTLAKQLSEQLQIPWYELDAIVHHRTDSVRYKRTAKEQHVAIMEIDRKGAWIFEGTDRDSYQYLYQMAETIVFVDTPLRVRIWRIVSRFVKQKLGLEPCHYKPDFNMLRMMFKWTGDYERNKTAFEAKLLKHGDKVIRRSEMKKKRPNGLAVP